MRLKLTSRTILQHAWPDHCFLLTDNHKPTLSSDTAPATAKLKPSSSSSGTPSYDLSFTDDGGKYAYSGTRSTKENQYALIFDPERKAFVLHRLDSTFNMNLTRTPSNPDPDALKDEHPHLDSSSIRVSTDSNNKTGTTTSNSNKKKGSGRGPRGNAAKNAGMVENKRGAAAAPSSSTIKAKAKAAEAAQDKKKEERMRSPRSPNDSEDEDNSDDDGLLIEYPDPQPGADVVHSSFGGGAGRPHQQQHDPPIRRFSEFMANQPTDDSDADAEYDEDDLVVDHDGADSSAGDFKLPSPVGRSGHGQHNGGGAEEGGNADAEGEDEDTPEDEELMAMLEEEMGEAGEAGAMDVDSESSVSEED